MTDFYSEDPPISLNPKEETQRWYQRIAIAMAISFFFPLYISILGTSKLIFPNIELIGTIGFGITLLALYPLLAAIIIIIAMKKTTGFTLSLTPFITGIFPFLLIFLTSHNLFYGTMANTYRGDSLMLLIPISLIGVYMGAKVHEIHGIKSGQIIGGISGIVFLAFILLPLSPKGMPMFFRLFKLLKTGSGSIFSFGTLLVIAMICIVSLYFYASFISILNMRDTDNSTETALRIKTIVFRTSIALPICFMVLTLFSSGITGLKMYLFTFYIKYFLEIGAIIGLIALSSFDLISHSIPKTLKGKDLFNTPGNF